MSREMIQQRQARFDALARAISDDDAIEFWFARELHEPLGYARWENFLRAIQRAVESCRTAGYEESDRFRGVTKMVGFPRRFG